MKNRKPLAFALAAAALTGCTQAQVEEIWAFYLGQFSTETDTQSVSHNYTDAYEPDATSSWTTTDEDNQSDAVVFGEVIGLDNGESLLVINNRTYVGTSDGDATTFAWERFDNGNSRSSHSSGYTYTHDWDDSQLTEIKLNEGDASDTWTGSWTATTTTDDTWNEDDEWDSAETGQQNSQIPSGNYLMKERPTGGEGPASNRSTDVDCDSSPCNLAATTTFTQTRTVTAVLTDYTADELDRTLNTSGQQAGF